MNIDTKAYGKGAVVLALVGAIAYGASAVRSDPAPLAPKPGAAVVAEAVYGFSTPAEGIAPARFASAPEPRGLATRHVFDRLVEYDRRSDRIVAGLATRWEISDDGRTYTFHLRKNVVFHTTPAYTPEHLFAANDVVFTFARLMKDTHPFRDARDAADFATVGLEDLIASVGQDGPDKVVFSLTVAYPKFLGNLAMDFASIRSEEHATRMTRAGTPEKFRDLPVGTGPMVAINPGNGDARAWRYALNPDYWGDTIPADAPKELPKQVIPPSSYGID